MKIEKRLLERKIKTLKTKIVVLLFVASMFAIPAISIIWSDCSAHVCTSPGCSVAAIEAFEAGTSCANWGFNGGSSTTPASGTICERGDTIGTKEVVSYLNCINGDCSVTGKFKCPQPGGGFSGEVVNLTCPSRNLGGTVYTPAVHVGMEYLPELGAYGGSATCGYPDGYIFAVCDSGGNVGYGTTF